MRVPEIHLASQFGKEIIDCLHYFNIKKIIEIGAGSGNGSTQCFIKYLDSFEDESKELHCFEPMQSWFDDLKKVTEDKNYCRLYNSSAISYEDLLVKDFNEDFYNTEYNALAYLYSKDELKSWYDQDIPHFKSMKVSILPTIEAEAVLIDGSEFSGYSEFKQLNKSISLIFLDDCYTAFKNRQTFEELIKNPNWKLISAVKERNGYAIFRKINNDISTI